MSKKTNRQREQQKAPPPPPNAHQLCVRHLVAGSGVVLACDYCWGRAFRS